MRHFANADFWAAYARQSEEARALADKNFALLKGDPRHASPHFKQVGRFWSARVGLRHRALAVETGEDLVWFWIGTHSEYDRLLR